MVILCLSVVQFLFSKAQKQQKIGEKCTLFNFIQEWIVEKCENGKDDTYVYNKPTYLAPSCCQIN